ncbi:unnamed protein product [Mytilus edulis]|uniref:Uncharacterized protein n=1 Tax=Mytilus edulis TaxID=6550 RepID=A0A8S3PPA0_MYTED|nr:unnamed protein product [Mytilus edulis]
MWHCGKETTTHQGNKHKSRYGIIGNDTALPSRINTNPGMWHYWYQTNCHQRQTQIRRSSIIGNEPTTHQRQTQIRINSTIRDKHKSEYSIIISNKRLPIGQTQIRIWLLVTETLLSETNTNQDIWHCGNETTMRQLQIGDTGIVVTQLPIKRDMCQNGNWTTTHQMKHKSGDMALLKDKHKSERYGISVVNTNQEKQLCTYPSETKTQIRRYGIIDNETTTHQRQTQIRRSGIIGNRNNYPSERQTQIRRYGIIVTRRNQRQTSKSGAQIRRYHGIIGNRQLPIRTNTVGRYGDIGMKTTTHQRQT